MSPKKLGRLKEACPLRGFGLIWLLLLVFVPHSIHAEYADNDLLTHPAVQSEKVTDSLLLDIEKAGKRLVVVGERGHILYSDDNGVSWQQVHCPTSVTLTGLSFPTSEKGWAVGHDGVVLHTNDGGESWVVQLNGFEENKLNSEHAKMLLSAKELELESAAEDKKMELTDELEELRYQYESYEAAVKDGACCDPLLDVYFLNDREGFVIGAYGLFFHTDDGGTSWTPSWNHIANPDKRHLNAFAANEGNLYIAGESGMLFRSRDGGKSWDSLASPYEGSYLGIITSPKNDFVIAFGIGAKRVLSLDGGDSWKTIQTTAGAALSGGTIRENGDALIVSYSGVIMTGSGQSRALALKKIGAGWNSVVDTGDGYIVLVGLKGVKRVPFDSENSGG
ncbi:MAG: hypothetical protein FP816_17440 [Desulfobacteraceae bacterium]|nr:hypothetical protein [Desulfobacteraceae bacterium]MBU4054746.1 hypothetical protein [Pseudomonadota bacterium]